MPSSCLTVADRAILGADDLSTLDAQLVQLEERIPKSIAAFKLQNRLLDLLAETVGARIYNRNLTATNRQLVETAVPRHHVKGTHASVEVLGRILGLLDLKVRELWSRFAIKDPGEPGNAINEFDYSDVPDDYPYWPRGHDYDGVVTSFDERVDDTTPSVVTPTTEVFQVPPPSPSYNPNVLDDGGIYTVDFARLTPDQLSDGYYLDRVNGHNPFGNFRNDVLGLLRTGAYYLSGGNSLKPATVTIPYDQRSGVRGIVAIRSGDTNQLVFVVTKEEDGELVVGQQVYLSGTMAYDGFHTISYLAEVGNTWVITVPYTKVILPSPVGALGHLTFSADGFVMFEALAPGSWANAIELTVLPEVENRQTIRLIGPQSKIKFKSSVFDLAISGDISLFPAIYHCVPSEPSLDGSLSDLQVGGVLVDYDITYVDVDYIGSRYPRFTLDIPVGNYPDGTVGGITVGTFVKVTGLSFGRANTELRRVIEVDRINGAIVIEGKPGALQSADPIFSYAGSSGPVNPASSYLTFGRVAGDYPIVGNPDGTKRLATVNDKVMDLVSFSDLLASLRDLLEEIRPISRTQRIGNNGFLLQDQVRYAPFYVKDHVVLQTPDGYNYRLRVDADQNITWEAVAANLTPTPITQRDLSTRTYGRWSLSRSASGVVTFAVIPVVSAASSDIVFITDGVTKAEEPDGDVVGTDGLVPGIEVLNLPLEWTGFQGYVGIEGGALTAYVDLPEQLMGLHGDGTEDESGTLAIDLPRVAENQPTLADCMSAAAQTTDLPSAALHFHDRPEDEIDLQFGVADSLTTMLPGHWPSGPDDYVTIDEAWRYQTDGKFQGRDPRTRMTGVLPDVVQPLATGMLFHGYPIRFLDHRGGLTWRNRVTNVPYRSVYYFGNTSLGSGAADINEVPTRTDTSLVSFDGQIEGANVLNQQGGPWTIPAIGFGVTPNNQTASDPNIWARLWQPSVSTDFESVANYTSVVSDGGLAKLIIPGPSGRLAAGMPLRLTGGPYTTARVKSLASVGGNTEATLDVAYSSGGSGTIQMQLASMQLWVNQSITLTIVAHPDNTTNITYRVSSSSPVVTGTVAPASTLVRTIAATGGELLVELGAIPAGQRASVKLARDPSVKPIITSTSKGLWGSGRDAIEMTILPANGHFKDFCADQANTFQDTSKTALRETYERVTTDPNSAALNLLTGRGGGWRGVSGGYSVVARGVLPRILTTTDV